MTLNDLNNSYTHGDPISGLQNYILKHHGEWLKVEYLRVTENAVMVKYFFIGSSPVNLYCENSLDEVVATILDMPRNCYSWRIFPQIPREVLIGMKAAKAGARRDGTGLTTANRDIDTNTRYLRWYWGYDKVVEEVVGLLEKIMNPEDEIEVFSGYKTKARQILAEIRNKETHPRVTTFMAAWHASPKTRYQKIDDV